jgi:nucleotide-binding universal stress UspA family protein
MKSKDIQHKSIVVPTDFTEAGDNAVLHAVELAKPTSSLVYVLHVLDIKESDNEMLVYAAIEKITQLSNEIDYDLIEPIVKFGDIFTTINDVAVAKQSDCIVLGTHGKKGIQKLLGSYALKVINSTHVPVLVVQEQAMPGPIKKIVFPVDINEEDRQKTGYAVKLAKSHEATIHVFPKIEKLAQNRLKNKNIIKQIVDFINDHDVDYEVAQHYDTDTEFSKLVVNYSNAIHADLILILSDSKSHFNVLGAKEEEFLFNLSNIPVLCVSERL